MADIVAIDPSISCTGLAFGSNAEDVDVLSIASRPTSDAVAKRIARFEQLVGAINQRLDPLEISLIVIEGYSFGSQGKQHTLAEFGGILRWNLLDHCPRVLEVAPTALKKFATGNGNAKKDLVMAHVAQRWGKLFQNSDQADAYVLYRMGLVIVGREKADNEAQREAVKKVTG